MAQTEIQTSGHCNYMTDSAQWGRFSENKLVLGQCPNGLNSPYPSEFRKSEIFNLANTMELHCNSHITLVVKCVKLLFPKVLRN